VNEVVLLLTFFHVILLLYRYTLVHLGHQFSKTELFWRNLRLEHLLQLLDQTLWTEKCPWKHQNERHTTLWVPSY